MVWRDFLSCYSIYQSKHENSLNDGNLMCNKAKFSAKQLRSNVINELASIAGKSSVHQQEEELQWSVSNCGGPQ